MTIESRLLAEAADYYGVPAEGIWFPKRGYYTKVRWVVALVLIDHVGWTERRVARWLRKHHSVIADGLKQSRSLLRVDPQFFEIVERLRQIVSPL